MQEIICKKKGLNIQHMWFHVQEFNYQSDIIFIHDSDKKDDLNDCYYLKRVQKTVISDLTKDIEVLQKDINKNYRYEIRRAEKENILTTIFFSKDMKKDSSIIDKLALYYEEMFSSKDIKSSFNRKLVEKYIEADCFMVSVAKNGNNELVFHSYIVDKNTTRLLYSCSLFRSHGVDKNLVGRANKYLHWCDIKYFKEHGYEIYDWGGITSFEKPNGIDKFKMEFGGKYVVHYNYIIGVSRIGKIILKILDFMGRI